MSLFNFGRKREERRRELERIEHENKSLRRTKNDEIIHEVWYKLRDEYFENFKKTNPVHRFKAGDMVTPIYYAPTMAKYTNWHPTGYTLIDTFKNDEKGPMLKPGQAFKVKEIFFDPSRFDDMITFDHRVVDTYSDLPFDQFRNLCTQKLTEFIRNNGEKMINELIIIDWEFHNIQTTRTQPWTDTPYWKENWGGLMANSFVHINSREAELEQLGFEYNTRIHDLRKLIKEVESEFDKLFKQS